MSVLQLVSLRFLILFQRENPEYDASNNDDYVHKDEILVAKWQIYFWKQIPG